MNKTRPTHGVTYVRCWQCHVSDCSTNLHRRLPFSSQPTPQCSIVQAGAIGGRQQLEFDSQWAHQHIWIQQLTHSRHDTNVVYSVKDQPLLLVVSVFWRDAMPSVVGLLYKLSLRPVSVRLSHSRIVATG